MILSYKEAAEYMGYSVSTMYTYISKGILPFEKHGYKKMFDTKDLDAAKRKLISRPRKTSGTKLFRKK